MKHLQVFWLWVKETNKRFWCYWLGFTDVDGKVLSAYAEARGRYRNIINAVKGE